MDGRGTYFLQTWVQRGFKSIFHSHTTHTAVPFLAKMPFSDEYLRWIMYGRGTADSSSEIKGSKQSAGHLLDDKVFPLYAGCQTNKSSYPAKRFVPPHSVVEVWLSLLLGQGLGKYRLGCEKNPTQTVGRGQDTNREI